MKKVFLIFLLIFSLLVINNKEYKCEAKNNDFEKIEKYVIDNYDFVENGIKVEYTVSESLKNEYLRIKEFFERNNYLINIEENNSINVEKDGINYDVNIYKYGDLTKVQIILINNDVNKTEKDLNELSKEIRSDNFINERYFSFIKGKINTEGKKSIDDLEEDLHLKIKESLNINNGYISEAISENDQDINIGRIKYDTGHRSADPRSPGHARHRHESQSETHQIVFNYRNTGNFCNILTINMEDNMEKIIVRGGRNLQGEVDISIAKNSVLPIIVATILNPTEIILKKVPMLEDVTVLINLLRELNCEVQFSSITGDLKINTLNLKEVDPNSELIRKMRASFLVMGPMLARFGRCKISMPGGCNIGSRPVDLHLKGFKSLGIDFSRSY